MKFLRRAALLHPSQLRGQIRVSVELRHIYIDVSNQIILLNRFTQIMKTSFAKRLLSTSANLVKTPLHELHIEYGGKMVPYAGFEMPVLYKGQSHIDSHNWVRNKAGVFDVSHMLQHNFRGKEASDLLQKITPIDLSGLEVNSSSLTVLLNEQGGVIDDCIITRHGPEEFYMVTNAGCREKDVAFIKRELEAFDAQHETFEGTLLALQGPEAAQVLQKFTPENLKKLTFGHTLFLKFSSIVGSDVHIARSGYTGEDGFELSIPSSTPQQTEEARQFFKALIEDFSDTVKPIGLAARDSLRLEAGMCLYGHELSESKTPIEASLTWLIPKTRRDNASFNGASTILAQIKDKSLFSSRRVGLTSKGPSPREGSKVFSSSGEEVGYISSGSPSPTLGGNIAQGYVDKSVKLGSSVDIEIRGKRRPATLVKMPFVPSRFYRGE